MADGKSPFNIPKFKFSIVEITRGGKGKQYSYYGENKLKKYVVLQPYWPKKNSAESYIGSFCSPVYKA